MQHQQQQHAITRQISRQGGYQLKVGGVVVGQWASSAPLSNRGNIGGVHARLNRAAAAAAVAGGAAGLGTTNFLRYTINARGRHSVNTRLQRNFGHQHVSSLARTISRNTYGNKINRTRNRRNRNKDRKNAKQTKDNADKSETDKEQADDNENTDNSKDLPSNESQNG